jgi:hypothetical protein
MPPSAPQLESEKTAPIRIGSSDIACDAKILRKKAVQMVKNLFIAAYYTAIAQGDGKQIPMDLRTATLRVAL